MVGAIMFLAASCNVPIASVYGDGTVELARKKINIQVADEPLERQLGLSGRESLGSSEGMLFSFDMPQSAGFWMKDMLFPIDIIWIRDGQVVDLSLNAQPEPGKMDTQLKIYRPKSQIDTVLELQAGWVTKNNLSIGDEVKIRLNHD